MAVDQGEPLARIADALERLVPLELRDVDWTSAPAFAGRDSRFRPIARIDALPLDRLKGIDRQKQAVVENVARLARGFAAHDMLLWGARGMGKSALVRTAVAAEQAASPGRLAMIQVDAPSIGRLPELFEALGAINRQFLLYLDDLAFDHGGEDVLRYLRSALDGGLAARPGNIRLAVTSNHRAILSRDTDDQAGPLHDRDRMDDTLALADRFGLRLGFHPCDQAEYLAIVEAHARPLGLHWSDDDALEWSRARGPLSGRSAWQFVVEIAGRAGKSL